MSHPFQSFELLNPDWDVHLLDAQSLRRVYVMLSLDLFMLGMLTSMMVYDVFRLHRFNWSTAILLTIFILPVARYSRLIYRQLGR